MAPSCSGLQLPMFGNNCAAGKSDNTAIYGVKIEASLCSCLLLHVEKSDAAWNSVPS